ncbi:MAG: transforming growth factor-beta-induced protein [Candidatus Aldehydirespiratoraceae bacterium]
MLADQEVLTSILTYHVIGGPSYDAAGLGELGSSTTVNGAELTFSADGTAFNGVDVLCSNVTTTNATVHPIDGFLMPA